MRKIVLLQLILIASVLISCTDEQDNTEINNSQSDQLVLTADEYASIAYDNPKELSENEIINIINDFQCIKSQFRNKAVARNRETSKISILTKYYLTNNNDTIENSATRSMSSSNSSKISIPIYELKLDQNNNEKDLVIVCGDKRASKVLFYAENYDFSTKTNLGREYLVEIAKQSIFQDIELIEKIRSDKRTTTLEKISKMLNIPKELITQELIEKCICINENENEITRGFNNSINGEKEPSRIISMVTPMTNILWKQEYPYNLQMPIGPITDGGKPYQSNYLVGCANVAVGLLFSILKPSMVGVTLTGRQILIDWDYITSVENIFIDEDNPTQSSPNKMIEMIGGLLRAIYNGTKSKPDYADIEYTDEDENIIKTKAIISTSTSTQNMLDYIQTMATYSGEIKFDANLAKQSLQDQKPVLLFGLGHYRDKNNNPIQDEQYQTNPGHAWLIDGYCMTRKSRQIENDQYWSVNMGWGKWSRAYFKTESNFQDCDVVFQDKSGICIVYYTQEQSMIYNLEKK